jgi:hypothetical protein
VRLLTAFLMPHRGSVTLLFWLLFGLPSLLVGQQKYEREFRIKATEVPDAALTFVQNLNVGATPKWFREESLDGHTIEAKFKHQKQKYSIEFLPNGTLVDIEIETKFKNLPDSVQRTMLIELSARYVKTHFQKIQVQHTGLKTGATLTKLEDIHEKNFTQLRYEVVLKAKTVKGWQWLQVTFAQNGSFIEALEIVTRPTDNLEF